MKINLEDRGVCISAFKVWFPQEKSKGSAADENDDHLEKTG